MGAADKTPQTEAFWRAFVRQSGVAADYQVVAFGDGPHVCLGAHFARLQLRIFYREFLWRLPDLEAAGPPARLVSNFIAGIKHLPVRFAPS